MGACNSTKKDNKKLEETQVQVVNTTEYNTNIEKIALKNNDDGIEVNTVRESNIEKKIQPPKKPIKELDNLKKAFPFLPHIYNSFSKDETIFYKNVINIKKTEEHIEKVIMSLDDLKFYLGEFNQDDIEIKNLKIVWRLFKWITSNIKYENIIRDEEYESFSVDYIFCNKSASSYSICKFANLILSHFSIDSIVIPGYLKGSNYKRGSEFVHVNHEWLGVMIFKQYRIIDFSSASLNSPYYSEKEEMLSFKDFFFCSPPQHIIYTHFPKKIEHTFLTQGNALLDKSVFERLPILKMNYFIYGFQNYDYKNCEIDFQEILLRNSKDTLYLNEINVSFTLPVEFEPKLKLKHPIINEDKLIYLTKRKFNRETENKKISMVDYYFYYESYLQDTINKNEKRISDLLDTFRVYEVSLRLPKKGNYELEVFAGKSGDKYDYCFSYHIENANIIKDLNTEEVFFPITSETFLQKNCSIVEPLFYHLDSYFNRKRNINFSIRIPNSTNAAIFYDGQNEFVLMNKKEEGVWTYSHNITKTFQNLVIAASFDDSMEYTILVTYTV